MYCWPRGTLFSSRVCGGKAYGERYGRGYGILPGSEGSIIGIADRLVEDSVVGAGKERGVVTGAGMTWKSFFGYLKSESERRLMVNASARRLRVEGSLSFLRTKYRCPSGPRSTQVVLGFMKVGGERLSLQVPSVLGIKFGSATGRECNH